MRKSSKKKSIHVIGVDASGIDCLSNKEKKIILSSKYLAAPKRLVQPIKEWLNKNKSLIKEHNIYNTDKINKLIDWIIICKENIVIISSGDPLWFGIGNTLLKKLPKDQLIFHPSPSSLQIAFARLKRTWQDAVWISLHGRDPALLIKKLQVRPNTIGILTDPNKEGAEEVRKILNGVGLDEAYEFWICERLGHQEEKIFQINPKEPIRNLNSLHLVLLIEKQNKILKCIDLPIIGIPDGIYLQSKDNPGLMTKKEIRVQVLSELELPEEGILWDLGAGVGSIGLEALRLRPKIKLLAIEKRYGSKDLINKNSKILGVKPTFIIEGNMLDIFKEKSIPEKLSSPNRVVIGGGGTNRKILLEEVLKVIQPEGIIIITLSTIEGISEINSYLKQHNLQAQTSQHQNWRGVSLGDGTRLAPLNPVFIMKIKKNQIKNLEKN